MQLSRFSDLAFRSLMVLTVSGERDVRLTTASIAESVNSSASHTAKAIARLVDLGLVNSRRGRGGGHYITDRGLTASVGSVLRELEGDREIMECGGDTPCPLEHHCVFRTALDHAREAFFVSLEPLTVQELAHTPTREALLRITAEPEPVTTHYLS